MSIFQSSLFRAINVFADQCCLFSFPCFPEYFPILVLSILSPPTCPPPPPPKQVFRVSERSRLKDILQALYVRLICRHCCIVITVLQILYYGRDRVKPHYKLRIQIVIVITGKGGERVFLRKSG